MRGRGRTKKVKTSITFFVCLGLKSAEKNMSSGVYTFFFKNNNLKRVQNTIEQKNNSLFLYLILVSSN